MKTSERDIQLLLEAVSFFLDEQSFPEDGKLQAEYSELYDRLTKEVADEDW